MVGIHGLEASLSLLEELGMDQVEKEVLGRSRFLIEEIGKLPEYDLLTTPDPMRVSGIVTFKSKENSLESLSNELKKNGVECAIRSGGVRLSPHYYTPMEQLEQVVKWLSDAA